MENYKQQIIDRGYVVVAETEDGISFVNESVQMCAMLLNNYNSISGKDKDVGHELHKTLKDKFHYSEKCTICIISNVSEVEDKESIQRNEYYFIKIFTDRINILPIKSNKDILIKFSPMKDALDLGDYAIDPFDYFDGLCSTKFIEYLSKAKDGDVVKYPKIVDNRFFRYYANKMYKIENID